MPPRVHVRVRREAGQWVARCVYFDRIDPSPLAVWPTWRQAFACARAQVDYWRAFEAEMMGRA